MTAERPTIVIHAPLSDAGHMESSLSDRQRIVRLERVMNALINLVCAQADYSAVDLIGALNAGDVR